METENVDELDASCFCLIPHVSLRHTFQNVVSLESTALPDRRSGSGQFTTVGVALPTTRLTRRPRRDPGFLGVLRFDDFSNGFVDGVVGL